MLRAEITVASAMQLRRHVFATVLF